MRAGGRSGGEGGGGVLAGALRRGTGASAAEAGVRGIRGSGARRDLFVGEAVRFRLGVQGQLARIEDEHDLAFEFALGFSEVGLGVERGEDGVGGDGAVGAGGPC